VPDANASVEVIAPPHLSPGTLCGQVADDNTTALTPRSIGGWAACRTAQFCTDRADLLLDGEAFFFA
jgi:hypothetical protein